MLFLPPLSSVSNYHSGLLLMKNIGLHPMPPEDHVCLFLMLSDTNLNDHFSKGLKNNHRIRSTRAQGVPHPGGFVSDYLKELPSSQTASWHWRIHIFAAFSPDAQEMIRTG